MCRIMKQIKREFNHSFIKIYLPVCDFELFCALSPFPSAALTRFGHLMAPPHFHAQLQFPPGHVTDAAAAGGSDLWPPKPFRCRFVVMFVSVSLTHLNENAI